MRQFFPRAKDTALGNNDWRASSYGFIEFKNNADALQKEVGAHKAGMIEKLAEQIAATGGNASRMRPDVLKNTVEEFNAAGEIACGLNRGGAMLTDALVFGIVCGKTMTA